MKTIWILLIPLLFVACKENPTQPPTVASTIVAYVHWGTVASSGIKIELVETGETKLTDAYGVAVFSVPAGSYTVRAFGINRGGPISENAGIDFNVVVQQGKQSTVDIINCLLCV